MSFKHDARDCLEDIIHNAERSAAHLGGLDKKAFEASSITRDAVERCIERACEAVVRLGDRAEALMPSQPWGEIRGMGNRLRHAYDRINVDLLLDTVRYDLPRLAEAASIALKNLETEAGNDPIAKGEDKKP